MPKAKATIVADTPEMKRLASNTKIQSNVQYHAEFEANKANLPLIRSMLEDVADDAAVLHMEKEDLIEDFLIAYQEALGEIGFTSRDIARMAAAALAV